MCEITTSVEIEFEKICSEMKNNIFKVVCDHSSYSNIQDAFIEELRSMAFYIGCRSLPTKKSMLFDLPDEILCSILYFLWPREINNFYYTRPNNHIVKSALDNCINIFRIGLVVYVAHEFTWKLAVVTCITNDINHLTNQNEIGLHFYIKDTDVTIYIPKEKLVKYTYIGKQCPKIAPLPLEYKCDYYTYGRYPHSLCRHGTYVDSCSYVNEDIRTAPISCLIFKYRINLSQDMIGHVIDLSQYERNEYHITMANSLIE